MGHFHAKHYRLSELLQIDFLATHFYKIAQMAGSNLTKHFFLETDFDHFAKLSETSENISSRNSKSFGLEFSQVLRSIFNGSFVFTCHVCTLSGWKIYGLMAWFVGFSRAEWLDRLLCLLHFPVCSELKAKAQNGEKRGKKNRRGSPPAANISIWQQRGSLKFTVCGGGFPINPHEVEVEQKPLFIGLECCYFVCTMVALNLDYNSRLLPLDKLLLKLVALLRKWLLRAEKVQFKKKKFWKFNFFSVCLYQ